MRRFITLATLCPSYHSTLCVFPPLRKILSSVPLPSSSSKNNSYVEYGFPNYQGPTPELYTFLGHVFSPYSAFETPLFLKVSRVGSLAPIQVPSTCCNDE